MQIKYSVQVDPLGTRQKFQYSFEGDILTVGQGELEEKFDFTTTESDGEFDVTVDVLAENPFISTKKENGEVKLVLRQYQALAEYMQKEGDISGN